MPDVMKTASDNDWRGESDYRSLQNACEIMADRVRMRGVLRHSSKQREANAKMSKMLAGYRTKKLFKGV